MDNNSTADNQPQALAPRLGLRVGLIWLASFGCSMYGTDYPLLGFAGNILGFFSIIMLGGAIRAIRAVVGNISWFACFHLALRVCLYATLITTLGQYLYFAFLDGGHFAQVVQTLLENPELFPAGGIELDTKTLVEALSAMTARDLIVQFLLINFMASLFTSLLAALIGKIGKAAPLSNNNPPHK